MPPSASEMKLKWNGTALVLGRQRSENVQEEKNRVEIEREAQ